MNIHTERDGSRDCFTIEYLNQLNAQLKPRQIYLRTMCLRKSVLQQSELEPTKICQMYQATLIQGKMPSRPASIQAFGGKGKR